MFVAVKRPGRIGIGYPALAGAALCLATGITNFDDALTVVNLVWNATLTLVAIIISSLVFDEAGFFDYVASRIAILGGRNRFLLFSLVIFLGAGVSTLFSNDGAVLILTPVVYSLLTRSGLEKKDTIPFLMGLCIISDTASNLLVVSNLTNIITAGYFHIGFLGFARTLAFPDAVSIIATLAMLLLYYRKEISRIGITVPQPGEVSYRDPLIIRIAGPYLAVLVLLYALGGIYGVPVGVIAVPAATVLSIAAYARRRVNMGAVLRSAPWQIVLFSLGIYIIVFGLGEQGLSQALSEVISRILALHGVPSIMVSGTFFAMLAAMLNNLPSVMMANLAISHTGSMNALIYANIIGNNIGPRFTPIGSLSTLLWMSTLERKSGIRISVKYFIKTGVAVGIPVLLVTLLAVSMV